MAIDKRAVKDFERVILRGYGEMTIRQGAEELLEIEADEELLPQIKTEVEDRILKIDVIENWIDRMEAIFSKGFESQRIKYDLSLKNLNGLDIAGAAMLRGADLKSTDLSLRLGGAANIDLRGLSVGRLKIDFPGAGSIHLEGEAEEQTVRVSGAGAYRTPHLKSQRANVDLTGVGSVVIWAEGTLDAHVSGVGRVEYYGSPEVTKTIQGLGRVTQLGRPRS
jgi:hypothetical protein